MLLLELVRDSFTEHVPFDLSTCLHSVGDDELASQ